MLPDGGGGGSTIVIDPDSLRRSGSRLKGVATELQRLNSALSSLDLPLLPPSVAGLVPEAISAGSTATSSSAPSLENLVVELTRRAFWAEYADQMMAGYTLSGPALQEFEQYLQDGTLLKYATADEARAAGAELAKVGANFRKDPQLLFTLAASLKGGESVQDQTVRDAFAGGFVNQFGATRMSEIPRAIQALESSRQLAFDSGITDPHVMRDLAQLAQEQGIEVHGDPVKDLLAPFSVALANATTAGLVTRTEEEKIASNEDAWSTAALLSQGGHFGTPFLLDCFKSGVVDKIAQDSPFHIVGNPSGPPLPVEYTLGWSDGHPLPNDTKQIILDALARNPQAASLALTQPVDVNVSDEWGQRSDVRDPLQLLYQYGHFDDHGAAFGHAYVAATDFLNQDHADVGPVHQGSVLTADALNLFLNDPGSPAPDQSAFAGGLAHDLGQNHMKDIYDSLGANQADGIAVNDVTPVQGSALAPGSLSVSPGTFTQILQRFGDHPTALTTLLHDGATYQAALIDVNTRSAGDPGWVKPIAAFNTCVFNATELHNVDQFNAADARHQAVVGFVKDVANSVVALDNPVADAIVHNGLDAAIDSALPGPDPTHVVMQNLDAKTDFSNNLRASITAGFYRNGMIDSTPPADIVQNGHLLPYGHLDGEAKRQYNAWMQSAAVNHVVDPVDSEVTGVLSRDGIDLF